MKTELPSLRQSSTWSRGVVTAGSGTASNIAEGYERERSKDRVRFLVIAKGSCAECWIQLLIGTEAGFIERTSASPLVAEVEQIYRMLRGLIAGFDKRNTAS
jgi:four helix bundle protein